LHHFFCGEISQNCENKKGLAKGACNLGLFLKFFLLDFNHHANQEVVLTMDGLDPLLPKSNGHNPLVITLLTERKTYHHFVQIPQCPSPPPLQQAKVPSPLEVIVEHEVSAFES